MGCEFLSRHLFWGNGGWSGNGGCWLWGCGFSLLLRTISTEMPPLSASETQTLLHKFSPLLVCHGLVNFGNNIDVHRVFVLLLPEVPSRFSLLLLWSIPFDDSLNLVVIVMIFLILLCLPMTFHYF